VPTTTATSRWRAPKAFLLADAVRPRPVVVALGVLFGIALVASVAVTLAFDSYAIPSEAMSPTLQPGDRILARTGAGDAGRGDIVVYRLPGIDEGEFISRVVAVGGDRIDSVGGRLRVNGRLRGSEPTIGVTAQTVPARSVFLMGDNRSDSRDSRFFGPVPRSNLVARLALEFAPDRILLGITAVLGLATVVVAFLFGASRLPPEDKVSFRDLGRIEAWEDPWSGGP
jgi:signal peptidase I